MDFNTLTLTLNNFKAAFAAGHALIVPTAQWLMYTLVAIEIVLIGVYWALSGNEQILNVIKKVLFFGFWLWIVTNFPNLANSFVQSLISVGLVGGGKTMADVGLIMDPSRIAAYGLNATAPLAARLSAISWDFVDAIVIGLTYILIMLAFFIVAFQVFLTLLEFYLVAALSAILLPFGFLQYTKFLAEKALGAVVHFGVKLMVLAFIIAITDPVLAGLAFTGTEIAWNELWAMLLTVGAIAFLAWNAPGIAAGLLSGSPSLSAGTAMQNTAAGAVIGGAAAAATVGAVRSAATAGGTLSAGATRLAGAASTGYQLGSATSTGGALAQAGSGVAGGLKSSANALIQSTLGRASSSVGSAAARNFSVGSSAGYKATGGTPSAGMKSAADAASAGASGGGKSAPAWAQRALHAMHAVPQEARPSGGGALPKL